ncbi:MAG: hypothetical protein G01um101418_796 [Parcubacteria group bacterium Gr01-1014_18]|nr:MAG: hypothetical protein Greene041636_678 [Parcubacteria group bacterium Greene0416_36]TSC80098.1 MAG: hypothetical protein G01um101418_796 [Parcubacteria group bacterium Gr01-1014_18]TSC98612.1 MAG: hypothetical protein Greene101420_664 [Parcubacteria group bacterium Greene1014_20]TSD06439.1 MAG: hypothetical protein Greene07142_930 [Parcubacteria group bacterium Greene0714_2]
MLLGHQMEFNFKFVVNDIVGEVVEEFVGSETDVPEGAVDEGGGDDMGESVIFGIDFGGEREGLGNAFDGEIPADLAVLTFSAMTFLWGSLSATGTAGAFGSPDQIKEATKATTAQAPSPKRNFIRIDICENK